MCVYTCVHLWRVIIIIRVISDSWQTAQWGVIQRVMTALSFHSQTLHDTHQLDTSSHQLPQHCMSVYHSYHMTTSEHMHTSYTVTWSSWPPYHFLTDIPNSWQLSLSMRSELVTILWHQYSKLHLWRTTDRNFVCSSLALACTNSVTQFTITTSHNIWGNIMRFI